MLLAARRRGGILAEAAGTRVADSQAVSFASDAGSLFAPRKRPSHIADVPRGEDQLTVRLHTIAAEVASPEDALDPMLRAIMESIGAAAGAICLYDVRQRLLRLAAEAGLSDEGCRRLRIVRKGEVDAWEMPMHGLVNGRAYLIENAAQNRFVPPLVEAAAEMSSVVCLPLYGDQKPLASIVLIALRPRTFAERQLHAVEGPLQEVARVIEAVRRQAENRVSMSAVAVGPTATHNVSGAPVARSEAAAPPPSAKRTGASPADAAALARAEQERDRLAASLAAAQAAESARTAALRTELDRLRAKLSDVEAAEARERRTREEMEARVAGGASAGRLELQRAHDAVREAENGRVAALAESARLRAELDRLRLEAVQAPAPSSAADERAADLAAEVDRLRAKLAEAEAGAAHEQRAREELEGRLAGGVNAGQREMRQALAAARDADRQRLAAVAEAARLRGELELARLESAPGPADPGQRDERIGPLLAEIDRLRARLAEAEAGAAHEHRAREELEARLAQGVATTQQELRHALEAARTAEEARAAAVAETVRLRAAFEQAEARAALAPGTSDEVDARVAELATEIDRLRTRVAEAEAGAAHQHRAREELETRLTGGVSSGQEELRRALAAAREAEQGRAAAVAEAARLGAEVERLRLAAAPDPERAAQAATRWTDLTAEIDRLHARLAEAEAGAAHEHQAREALEARLGEAVVEAQDEMRTLRDALRGLEDARDAAVAEAARLEQQLDETRRTAARLPELTSENESRVAALKAETEVLAAGLADAEARAIAERAAREAAEQRITDLAAEAERTRETALAELRASVTAEHARLVAALEAARTDAARADGLAAALAEAVEARRTAEETSARLAAERDAAARDAARAADEAATRVGREAEERRAEQTREHDVLRARLADAEASVAREQRAREALEAAASHDLGRVGEDLQRALDAVRVAEEGRDRVLADLAVERSELAAARASGERVAAELADLRVDYARLRTEAEAAQVARDEERARGDAACRAADELAQRLAEAERSLDHVRAESAAEATALRAHLDRMEAEQAVLREAHASTAAARDRFAAELAEAAAANARTDEALAAMRADADARQQAFAAVHGRMEAAEGRVGVREAEIAALRETAAAETAALLARIDQAVAEIEALRTRQTALGSERDRLSAELEGTLAAKVHLERSFQQAIEESRERERLALAAAEERAALVAERDAALRTIEERYAATVALDDARLREAIAELDEQREALARLRAEYDRRTADLEGAAAAKALLEGALAAALDEARSRASEVYDARGHVWDLALRIEQADVTLTLRDEEHTAQVARLNARLDTFLLAADQLREAHANIGAECDRLSAELEGALAAKVHLEESLHTALDDNREREREAEAGLETARAHHWMTAARLVESEQRLTALAEERAAEIAALTAQVGALEADADRRREASAAVAAERDRLAADLEGAAAAKTHLEEALKSALEAARSRDRDATVLLQEARGQAWAVGVRLAEAEASLRALDDERTSEIAALSSRAEMLAGDACRLGEAAADAAAERDRLAADLAGTRAAQDRIEANLAETRDREQALAARVAELEGEVTSLRTEVTAAEAARLEAETSRDAAEAARIAAEEARVAAEKARRAPLESRSGAGVRPAGAEAPASSGSPRSVPAAGTAAPSRSPLSPAAPSRIAPASAGGSRRAEAPASSLVAVLDDEGAWKAAAEGVADLMIVTPSDEAIQKLVAAAPGRILVNLAAPGAMKTLLAVRAGAAAVQIFGCVASADRALPLGRVEPASRPLAPDAIVAKLGALAPTKARVVTVGADVDALLSLRQALVRQGTSVSLAWDAKQAIDLLDMINPHAVVADLGAPQDAAAVLVRVAASSPVPIVVLIEGPSDAADPFTAVLNHPEVAAKIVSRAEALAIVGQPPGSGSRPRVPAARS